MPDLFDDRKSLRPLKHRVGADLWAGLSDGVQRRWARDLPDSPGALPQTVAVGSFLDELAVDSDREPLQFLLSLLDRGRRPNPRLWGGRANETIDSSRMRNVLLLTAARSGWRSPLPARHGPGLAAHRSGDSYVAAVAHVSVADDGGVSVPRLNLAVDCGTVANPDAVASELKQAVVTALRHALPTGSGVRDLRLHIARSQAVQGEPAEAAATAALTALINGVFAATGRRPQTLPVATSPLKLQA